MERVKWLLQGAITGAVVVEVARLLLSSREKQWKEEKRAALPSTKGWGLSEEGGGVVHHAYNNPRMTQIQSIPLTITSTSSAAAPVAPILPIVILQPSPLLEIAFDRRTKNPCYVLEKFDGLEKSTSNRNANSPRRTGKETFYEERSLYPYHRSRNSYYKNSGFDRGHLAPVADFTSLVGGAISSNQEETYSQLIRDTFNLCNISPQYPTFNRRIWANVEQFTRNIITEEFQSNQGTGNPCTAYVVTGPIYLPSSTITTKPSSINTSTDKPIFQFSYLGFGTPPSIVSVPTHFFKVIALVSNTTNTVQKAAAFVLPNQEFYLESTNTLLLDSYLVTFEDLEAVTGLEFFATMFGNATDDNNVVLADEDEEYTLTSTSTTPSTAITLRKLFFDNLTKDLIRQHRPIGINAKNFHTEVPSSSYSSSSTVVMLPSPPSRKSPLQRKIQKEFYQSKETPIHHLCQNNRCSIDLWTGKRTQR